MKQKQPALMIVIGESGPKAGPELSKKKPCPMCGCDCKSEEMGEEEDDMGEEEDSSSELDDLLYKAAEKRKGLK